MTNAARSRVFAARYGDQADSKMNEWNEPMNKTISLGAVCMAWGCRCVFYGKDYGGDYQVLYKQRSRVSTGTCPCLLLFTWHNNDGWSQKGEGTH
jgi:hypothetical protein